MKNKPVNIFFMVPYPMKLAPSQRFRVELFLPELDKAGMHYTVQSFIDERGWISLYKKGSLLSKLRAVIMGYARRWKAVLFNVAHYDFVFIHREAAPLGPPVFEWIISKMLRKKIVYDYDDAIWIPNTSKENGLIAWFKAFWKVKYICKWAYKVVGGNDYLCRYALQYNKNVVKIPTCVDTINRHNRLKDQHSEKMVIGWTGSQSTLKFLSRIVPAISELKKTVDFEFIIIADKRPEFPNFTYRFVQWNEASEVDDLLQLNIGVMPLDTDPWCEGKCGFKLIQYLSLGIPAVATPIGVNHQIIDVDKNGFLCEANEEWINSLTLLIKSESLRSQMGGAGRQKIIREFSVQAQSTSFLSLFD